MSKKNNQTTRRNMHAARLAKEKEAEEKRKAKLEHKAARLAAADKMGVAAPKRLKRKARKGVRIKKHVVVRGIKVTDAETKRKAKELLAAEVAMKELMMDAEGPGAEEGGDGAAGGSRDQAMRATVGSGPSSSSKKEKKVGVGGGARVKGGSSVKVKAGKGGKAGKGKAAASEGMALD